jgi:hypothetical protein
MKINKQLLKQYVLENKIYIFLFLLAFIIVSSASTYNPFNFRRMHVDSSVYITIAQGITKGQLPYKDLVDNKGPIEYLISAPGLALGGFTGIWITQIVFMFISVLFAWKTALFFGDKYKAIHGTIFSFVVLLAFYIVSAGTEEYSLPFLMISLYIFTKYYLNANKDINLVELIILGICFSCATLIRLNMFPLWAGFCLIIFFECIIKRQFVQLLKYVCGFCIGIAIILVPVFLYLTINDIFNDFWNLVILGGASRGFDSNGIKEIAKNFYVVINRNYSFFPLFFGLYLTINEYKKSYFFYYLGYTLSYALMIAFLSFSSGGSHYNMVLIPYFVVAFTVSISVIDFRILNEKTKKIMLIVFLCLIFSEGLVNSLYDLSKFFHDKSGSMLKNAGKLIDDNTKPDDTIISLGFNGYIYPFTQRNIASKYLYQGSGLSHIPGAREEFISDILTKKPAIIAVFTAEAVDGGTHIMPDWHKPIFDMIDTEYRLLSDENGFDIYIRNDK